MNENKEKKTVPLAQTVRGILGDTSRSLFGSNRPILESLQKRREERIKGRTGLKDVGIRTRTKEGSRLNEDIVPLRQMLADRIKGRERPVRQALAERIVPRSSGESEVEAEPEEQGEDRSQPGGQRDLHGSYSGKTSTRGGKRAM